MKSRVGEVNTNNFGTTMEIISYRKWEDIDVQFANGYIAKNKQYSEFRRGSLKSTYDRSVYGVGFLGEGKYAVKNKEKILTKEYRTWSSMMERCYSRRVHEKEPTYIGCTVTEYWHNFQNFAKWSSENYYSIEGEKIHLDKDILIKGNKIYSPDTCLFVPQSINNFFIKKQSKRGKYPIGVYFISLKDKYVAQCNDLNGKRKTLGYYDTPEKAFQMYKIYKENTAKELAEIYKYRIPQVLYDSLINYNVNIND